MKLIYKIGLSLLFILSVSLSLIWWFLGYVDQYINQPINTLDSMTKIEVKAGDTLTGIANNLENLQLIKNAKLFIYYAKYKNLTNIKTGEYSLVDNKTYADLLKDLNSGSVIFYQVTLLEGWTFRQALEHLHKQPKLRKLLKGLPIEAISARFNINKIHPEGLFFPDTYRYVANNSDVDILKKSRKKLIEVLEIEWNKRSPNLPFKNSYEALILASIIEKETGYANERDEISGVFVRRLQKKMRLQTDPTVIYGIGEEFDGNLTRKHLREETPYNTYRINGLPPTPIALASQASIKAALNPKPGTSLYFVANGNGKSVFSDTLKEHNKAVDLYQRKKNK